MSGVICWSKGVFLDSSQLGIFVQSCMWCRKLPEHSRHHTGHVPVWMEPPDTLLGNRELWDVVLAPTRGQRVRSCICVCLCEYLWVCKCMCNPWSLYPLSPIAFCLTHTSHIHTHTHILWHRHMHMLPSPEDTLTDMMAGRLLCESSSHKASGFQQLKEQLTGSSGPGLARDPHRIRTRSIPEPSVQH